MLAVNGEEPDFVALDEYIRSQLASAAETYASGTDFRATVQAIMMSGKDTDHDDAVAEDS